MAIIIIIYGNGENDKTGYLSNKQSLIIFGTRLDMFQAEQ